MKNYFIYFCIVASMLMGSSIALACDVKITVKNNSRTIFYGNNGGLSISGPWLRNQQNDIDRGASATFKFDGSALSCHGEYYILYGADAVGADQTVFVNGTITINKDADVNATIHNLDKISNNKAYFVSWKVGGLEVGPQTE